MTGIRSFAFLPLEEWSKEKEVNLSITGLEISKDKYVDKVIIHTTGWIEPKETYTFNPPAIILDFPIPALKKDFSVQAKESKHIKKVYTRPNPEEENRTQVVIELLDEADFEIINVFGKNVSYVEIFDLEKPLPTLAKGENPLARKLIAIDPGHGGMDTGTKSIVGRYEKHYCLETALKIAALLKKQGARVYLTRWNDKTTNYREFMPEVNKKDADIFIAIHYNAFRQRSAGGTETFYYTKKSKPLARSVHQSMLGQLGRRDRGIRRRMHYVTHHAKMPAIIVEPLYVTNREEERLARSGRVQTKIALAIVKGIKNYLRDYGANK